MQQAQHKRSPAAPPSREIRFARRIGSPRLEKEMRLLCLLLAFVAAAHAFTVQSPLRSAVAPRAQLSMGPAKDGPFTPAVLAAKVVLGEKTLGKVRGKAIAYHSQEINKFCEECECTPAHAIESADSLASFFSSLPCLTFCLAPFSAHPDQSWLHQMACRRS